MKRIAVLLTCHNRKNKTLLCLEYLFNAYESAQKEFNLSVYLTDDGCTDGTADAVLNKFTNKNITILKGSGSLYWAGGMRNSWNEAILNNYDGFLLLNDDTLVLDILFKDILETYYYSVNNFKSDGIFIGTTCAFHDKKMITYGGSLIINKLKVSSKQIIPNGVPQLCDWGNANIMFVTENVVKRMGILSDKFTHAIADYDYTLQAKKQKIPVLVMSHICGNCDNDHPFEFSNFEKMKFSDRIKFTYSPLGFALSDYLIYIRRNFWFRYPIVLLASWLKIFLPGIYRVVNDNVR